MVSAPEGADPLSSPSRDDFGNSSREPGMDTIFADFTTEALELGLEAREEEAGREEEVGKAGDEFLNH